MKTFFISLISSLFIVFLFSCKTQQKVYSNRDLKHLDKADIYDSIQANYGDYSYFYTKFSCTARQNNNSKSFKGTIKLRRDSLIWISITPGLGLELFRIQLTPDSIEFIDRMKSTYFSGDYASIEKLSGAEVNFRSIQSILLNEMFFYGNKPRDTAELMNMMYFRKTAKNIRISSHIERKLKNVLKENERPDILYHDFHVSNFYLRIEETEIRDYATNRSMILDYSDFQQYDSLYFPDDLHMQIRDFDKMNTFDLNLDFHKTAFKDNLNFNFSVPDSYKRLN